MDARYYRPASPRYRIAQPARASTGTFADPYYDSAYYGRAGSTSPRTSGERLVVPSSAHYTYAPSSSSGSRSSRSKYDTYSRRPRRNTMTESDDRLVKPKVKELMPTTIPIRAPAGHHHHHHHHDHIGSPLSRSFDERGETHITHAPSRREHTRIYSVDDSSRQAELIAERENGPRRRDSREPRGHNVTSGGKSYHYNRPHERGAELGDDAYSYTDAAGMYRDTEPVWRRPRSGSIERGSRPHSMTFDRDRPVPRSAREPGPPPSTRGFDKINAAASRDLPIRSSSRDRSYEKYEPYVDSGLSRSSSTRHKPATIHQEHREHRRDPYEGEYGRRDREPENHRHSTAERFEDRDIASRGFGIATGPPVHAPEHHTRDRQPVYEPPRPEEYSAQYYSPDRAEARMPEPRVPEPRIPEPRMSRDHVVPTYDERPRDREWDRPGRDRDMEERAHIPVSAPVAVAGAAAGAAATYGAAEMLKSRDRDRERDRDRDRERDRDSGRDREERDRDRRRERDERDRRDDRAPHDRARDERLPLASAAYASTQDSERRPDRRHEKEDDYRPRERREDDDRERRHRRIPSSEESGEDRPRHYVDPEAIRESERRKESEDAGLDPDEEYRRRIQLEAARSGHVGRESDSDRERDRERRRRREERERSRDPNAGSRNSPPYAEEPAHPRYEERSRSVLDKDIVQEPEPLNADSDQAKPSRSVQIVAPPKEPPQQPKGILRKPTEKFPEDPDPIREGVAPHKSALKGKDIPPGARWTKIDRRLVNPEALEEAKERFEERMDCVIVLRVLTKQEIQKLADRTAEIRAAREDDYDRERDDRRDRDRHSRHSHRDDEDRDRRRDYDDTDDDDVGRRDRGRDRDRDGPRMIESGRREKEKTEQYDGTRDKRTDSSDDHGNRTRRHERYDTRDDETSDDENLPPAKQETKLRNRLRRVLDWL